MTRRLKINAKNCALCGLCSLVCSEKITGKIDISLAGIRVASNLPSAYTTKISYCLQCDQGYCIEACPKKALYRNAENIVQLNIESCDSCNGMFLCVTACKFNGIYAVEGFSHPIKCDTCQGESPRCMDICPVEVIALIE